MARIQLKLYEASYSILAGNTAAGLGEGEIGIASDTKTLYKRPDGNPTGALVAIDGPGKIIGIGNLVLNSDPTTNYGGQAIFAYTGITGLTGPANSTWSVKVTNSNSFDVFTTNSSGTITNSLSIDPTTVSVNLYNSPTCPTATAGNATTQIANCNWVHSEVNAVLSSVSAGGMLLDSPTFTGTPTATGSIPLDDSTTRLATTGWYISQAAAAPPTMNGVATVGVSYRFSRSDHIHPSDTSRASVVQLQSATGGYISIALVNNSPINLSDNQASNGIIEFTGTPGGTVLISFPTTTARKWTIKNSTTDSSTLLFKLAGTGSAGDIFLYNSDSLDVYSTGSAIKKTTVAHNITNLAVASSNVTLTDFPSNQILNFIGTLTSNIIITIPALAGKWTFRNFTTGAYTISVKTAAGGSNTFTLPLSGGSMDLGSDGTFIFQSTTDNDLGKVVFFPVQNAPTGYLECAGQPIPVALYPNLAAFLWVGNALNSSATFGYRTTSNVSSNATFFRSSSGAYIVLPDLRGEFIRGWDHGRNVDILTIHGSVVVTNGSNIITGISSTASIKPGMSISIYRSSDNTALVSSGATVLAVDNANQITLDVAHNATGTTTSANPAYLVLSGRVFGSWEESENLKHLHTIPDAAIGGGTYDYANGAGSNRLGGSENTTYSGGAESRPRNIALLPCIQY
jgi:microcystin-dependent protein